jgi:hypothetical protein
MAYPVGAIIHFEGNKASPLGRGSHALFTPHTWWYHTAILGEYIPDENDYEILESIDSGIRLGRLSFYKNRRFRLYWPTGINMTVGESLRAKASKFGRLNYDYKFYFDLAIEVIRIQWTNLVRYKRFFSIRVDELNVDKHVNFVCTRFSKEFWSLYSSEIPFPSTWAAIPAAYELAVEQMKLTILAENVVKHVRLRDRIANKIFGRKCTENKWPRSLVSMSSTQR